VHLNILCVSANKQRTFHCKALTDWFYNLHVVFTARYVLPTQCVHVFCVNLRKTAIISLYSINWLVFITETECVYCAVRLDLCIYFGLYDSVSTRKVQRPTISTQFFLCFPLSLIKFRDSSQHSRLLLHVLMQPSRFKLSKLILSLQRTENESQWNS
jgi:hypothetical protein